MSGDTQTRRLSEVPPPETLGAGGAHTWAPYLRTCCLVATGPGQPPLKLQHDLLCSSERGET